MAMLVFAMTLQRDGTAQHWAAHTNDLLWLKSASRQEHWKHQSTGKVHARALRNSLSGQKDIAWSDLHAL